jgi:hypothetical protein
MQNLLILTPEAVEAAAEIFLVKKVEQPEKIQHYQMTQAEKKVELI